MNKTKELKLMLLNAADAFGIEFTPNRLNAYVEGLTHLNVENYRALYHAIVTTFDRYPTVKQICDVAQANENAPLLNANKILEAVVRFGWPNAQEAAEWLGPERWKIVQMLGGWSHLCETANTKQKGILTAQIRDLCSEVNVTRSAERSGVNPQLCEPGKVAQLVSDSVKEIK